MQDFILFLYWLIVQFSLNIYFLDINKENGYSMISLRQERMKWVRRHKRIIKTDEKMLRKGFHFKNDLNDVISVFSKEENPRTTWDARGWRVNRGRDKWVQPYISWVHGSYTWTYTKDYYEFRKCRFPTFMNLHYSCWIISVNICHLYNTLMLILI